MGVPTNQAGRSNFWCLQGAYIERADPSCKRPSLRPTLLKQLIFLNETGAGDWIRTHDPNLGKEEMAHPDTIRTCGLHPRRWRSIQLSYGYLSLSPIPTDL